MKNGLYWGMVHKRPDPRPFATILNCEDGEHAVPINPSHAGHRVVRVGLYIGTKEELTGMTAEHLKPSRPKQVREPEEQLTEHYYGA
jgi:hypothetical protein